LIPFKNIKDAKTFKMDHKGKYIYKFKDITEAEVYKLDIH
jgi:nitrous oxide reductase accessory protein NosL